MPRGVHVGACACVPVPQACISVRNQFLCLCQLPVPEPVSSVPVPVVPSAAVCVGARASVPVLPVARRVPVRCQLPY
jgi:hypothetical protein